MLYRVAAIKTCNPKIVCANGLRCVCVCVLRPSHQQRREGRAVRTKVAKSRDEQTQRERDAALLPPAMNRTNMYAARKGTFVIA